MKLLRQQMERSPVFARVAPFVIFIVLTFCQGQFGESSKYWCYLGKSLVGAWLIWLMWPSVREMRWALSWEAVLVGVGVFVMWVGIDGFYPKLGKAGVPWNPHTQFGQGSALAWLFIVARVLGSALVVPPLEEVLFRSFLYRYIIKVDFLSVPLNAFSWTAFLVTAAIFGFEHFQWLAGIVCGFAYQGLVLRRNRLGDAITAHAITNFLLGLWVIYAQAWKFW